MEASGELFKGHISTVILRSLCDGDKYGYEIAKIIEVSSQGKFIIKQPTLYSTLKRLQAQGLISSYWLDSEIGGRRHYYKLTEQGIKQIENSKDQWNASRSVIDFMVDGTNAVENEEVTESQSEVEIVASDELPAKEPTIIHTESAPEVLSTVKEEERNRKS